MEKRTEKGPDVDNWTYFMAFRFNLIIAHSRNLFCNKFTLLDCVSGDEKHWGRTDSSTAARSSTKHCFVVSMRCHFQFTGQMFRRFILWSSRQLEMKACRDRCVIDVQIIALCIFMPRLFNSFLPWILCGSKCCRWSVMLHYLRVAGVFYVFFPFLVCPPALWNQTLGSSAHWIISGVSCPLIGSDVDELSWFVKIRVVLILPAD